MSNPARGRERDADAEALAESEVISFNGLGLRAACERGNPLLDIEPVVGARVVPKQLALGPPADPLLLRIVGSGFANPAQLRLVSDRLKRIVATQPETWDVADSWGTRGYQVQVNVDPSRAVLAGVTNSQVAKTLNS